MVRPMKDDPARRPDEQLQDPQKGGSQDHEKQSEKTPGSHDPERKGRTDPGRRKSIGSEKEDASR